MPRDGPAAGGLDPPRADQHPHRRRVVTATPVTCLHCGRVITHEDGRWVDPAATGDDSVWRETCDEHDTFVADHEPKQAGLGVGHIWTATHCPAYHSYDPADCICVGFVSEEAGKPCKACASIGRLTFLDTDGTCRRRLVHR